MAVVLFFLSSADINQYKTQVLRFSKVREQQIPWLVFLPESCCKNNSD